MKFRVLVFFNISLLTLTSCSNLASHDLTSVKFPYEESLLASVQSKYETQKIQNEIKEKDEKKSPRRVYFGALYYQYLTLSKHLGKDESLNSCPQFHHDKLDTESYEIPEVLMYKASSIEKEGRNYFPELAFNKKFSIIDHHEELKQELLTLCEDGVSDNFYKFDNLVTYHAGKIEFHKNMKAMDSVLKIPVFANFYLLKMLQGSNPKKGVVHPDELRFIRMSQTVWFDQYIATASNLRNDYIKVKMVKR